MVTGIEDPDIESAELLDAITTCTDVVIVQEASGQAWWSVAQGTNTLCVGCIHRPTQGSPS